MVCSLPAIAFSHQLGEKVSQGVAAVPRGDAFVGGRGGGEGDQFAKPRVEGADNAAVHSGDKRGCGEVEGFAGPGGEFGDLAAEWDDLFHCTRSYRCWI